MFGGSVSKHKPLFLVVIFLIIALVAMPLSSIISYNSLTVNSTETISYGSKISRHYFTPQAETIRMALKQFAKGVK